MKSLLPRTVPRRHRLCAAILTFALLATALRAGATALSLNGAGDLVSFAPFNLNGGNALTIEAWVKPLVINATTYSEILRQQGGSAPDLLLSFQNNGNQLSFGLSTAAGYQELHVAINPAAFTDGNWHHVAATYDGATKRLYVDGSPVGAAAQIGSLVFHGGSCTLGASPLGGGQEFYHGSLDDLRVWNVCRTGPQITQAIFENPLPSTSGLVADYPLEDGAGLVAADATGNGHSGTLTGAVWSNDNDPAVSPQSPPGVVTGLSFGVTPSTVFLKGQATAGALPATAWFEYGLTTAYGSQTLPVQFGPDARLNLTNQVAGFQPATLYHWRMVAANSLGTSVGADQVWFSSGTNGGFSLFFDSLADSATAAPVNLGGANGLTLEAWINPVGLTAATNAIVLRQAGPGVPDFSLGFAAHGSTLVFGLNVGGSYQELVVPVNPGDFPEGTWHHLAATFDGTNQKLFRDGSLLATTNRPGALTFASASLSFGAAPNPPGGAYFRGLLDEIRIWNLSRGASELAAHSHTQLAGNEPGLIAYWPLEEGAGTATLDATYRGNPATLNGAAWSGDGAPVAAFVGAPFVSTGLGTGVGPTSASVMGFAIPGGLVTTAYFEYGPTTNYGSQSVSAPIGSARAPVYMTNLLANLPAGQPGHFRLTAVNSAGITHGQDQVFYTYGGPGGMALDCPDNSYVNAPVLDLTVSNAITIEAWIKPATFANTYYSVVLEQDYDWSLGFDNSAGGALIFFVGSRDYLSVPVNPASLLDGAWHHLAATYDGAQQVLYLDGLAIGSRPEFSPLTRYSTNEWIGLNYRGLIDEVRVWGLARTAADIRYFKDFTLSGTEPGLVAYWRMDEGTGRYFFDSSGHGNTAFIEGFSPGFWTNSTVPLQFSPVTTGPAAAITTNTATLTGTCNPGGVPTTVHFDFGPTPAYGGQTIPITLGSGSGNLKVTAPLANLLPGSVYHYRLVAAQGGRSIFGADQALVTAGASAGTALKFQNLSYGMAFFTQPIFPTPSLTFEAWIKPDTLTNAPLTVIAYQGYARNAWLVGFRNNGASLCFGLSTTFAYQELQVPVQPGDFGDGNWHHLAATYDGATQRLYRDGLLLGATNLAGILASSNYYSSISLGADFSGNGFVGALDEVRFWNTARTAAQLNQFKNQSLAGNEPGLLNYFRLDDAAGGHAADAAARGSFALCYSPNWVVSTAPIFGTLAPWIATLSPAQALAGDTVRITGGNLAFVTNCLFNGVPANFTVNPDTSLTAIVPPGASSGPVSVASPYGPAVSALNFVNDAAPTITIRQPSPLSFQTSLNLLAGTATDSPTGGGLTSVTVSLQRTLDGSFWDGSAWGLPATLPATLSGNSWSVTAGLPSDASLTDGPYLLTATVRNQAGFTGTASIGVTVRQSGPPQPAGLLPNGQVLLQWPALANTVYRIQASGDLVHWADLGGVLSDASGALSFQELANHSVRFYRVLAP